MIRIIKSERMNADVKYIEAAGLSTDEKPTNEIMTGSLFTEVDTGKVFAYGEGDPGQWYMIKDAPTS